MSWGEGKIAAVENLGWNKNLNKNGNHQAPRINGPEFRAFLLPIQRVWLTCLRGERVAGPEHPSVAAYGAGGHPDIRFLETSLGPSSLRQMLGLSHSPRYLQNNPDSMRSVSTIHCPPLPSLRKPQTQAHETGGTSITVTKEPL